VKYRFIDTQKARIDPSTGERVGFPIWLLCQTIEVPESSYYDWNAAGRARAEERSARDAALTDQIRTVHAESDGTYGAPRVTAELRDGGMVVSKRRVAALMQAAEIRGLSGREHSTTTTRRDRLAAPIPDLVDRLFLPSNPDVTWYGDITYIWIDQKFHYLATVIDACTKQVLGWALADHLRTELVSTALKMAVARRGGDVSGAVFHSDRGSQYTSDEGSGGVPDALRRTT
jgi:transposase InsO family protein